LATTPGWTAYGRVSAAFDNNAGSFSCHLYGVGLDEIVVSQTTQEQSDDTLLCFIGNEVTSVGLVIAYGGGLVTARILRHRFGTAAAAHAINADVFFIRRAELHLIDNANFIPGNLVKFKLQPFTHEQDYDLTSITPIDYTIAGFAEIDPPDLAPNGGTFVASVVVHDVNVPFGMIDRYTTDGTSVQSNDAMFLHAGITLTATTTLRVRRFAPNGNFSSERIATYTRTNEGQGNQSCAPPSRSFSGIQGYTDGSLTLTEVTTGSTIKFKKNNGAVQTYSSAIALVCNNAGDVVEYWATKAGLDDSAHTTFDNTRVEPGGGGHNRPPIIP
jgi:hypothetical protein